MTGDDDAGAGVDATRPDGGTTGDPEAVLAELFAVIEDRRDRLPEDSYTASLFTHEKGEDAVLEKLGEESTELILAAKDGDDEALTHEAADVVYHLLVLLAGREVPLEELLAELRDRR
jgi:phosphoribosyl-ATP pyrophosphohydrolase